MKQKNKPRLIMNEFFKYYYMSTFIGNKCTCVYAENICGQLIFFFPLLFLFGDILQTSQACVSYVKEYSVLRENEETTHKGKEEATFEDDLSSRPHQIPTHLMYMI